MAVNVFSLYAKSEHFEKYPYPFNDRDLYDHKFFYEGKSGLYAEMNPEVTTYEILPLMIEVVNKVIVMQEGNISGFGGWFYCDDKLVLEYPETDVNENPYEFINKYEKSRAFASKKKVLLAYNQSDGSVKASVSTAGVLSPYTITGRKKYIERKTCSEAAILCRLLVSRIFPDNMENADEQLTKCYLDVSSSFRKIFEGDDKKAVVDSLYENMAKLSDILERKVVDYLTVEKMYAGMGLKLDVPSNNVFALSKEELESVCGKEANAYGSLSFYKYVEKKEEIAEVKSVLGREIVRGMFEPSERVLEAELERYVPVIPEHYQLTDEIRLVGEVIKSEPTVRNIMFRGPAGTGKTEGVKILAHAMNRPYYYVTCSSDTETYDLLTQIVPVQSDGDAADAIRKFNERMPSNTEILLNPRAAWKKMTGMDNSGATQADCMQEYSKQLSSISKDKYKIVDSQLVIALRNGGVCEIQEPTVISKAGVLVGLNALFDKSGTVTLLTGEVIHRHKDTVIILTTNSEYEGCRNLNQSVISRMDMIFDIEKPADTKLAERVMNESGYTNKDAVERMIQVMHRMEEVAYANGITDGSIGVRELIAWRRVSKHCDPYKRAFYTIVSSASRDAESRTLLIPSLEKWFRATKKEETI